MHDLPEAVIVHVFGFLPSDSFLQYALVSKRFRQSWIQMKKYQYRQGNLADRDFAKTDPLMIGNIFPLAWRFLPEENIGMNTSLLKFYMENGYGKNKPELVKKVMMNAASRGDITGIYFMISNEYCSLDYEICTMSGAAGQLKTLRWLRGDLIIDDYKLRQPCPWDPTEVHREAAENSHDDIIEFVEKNSNNHQIQTHYGVGLPW